MASAVLAEGFAAKTALQARELPLSAMAPDHQLSPAGPNWSDWLARRCLPPVEAVALVPVGARAVVVAPHPDDELLGTGGLLSAWASEGRKLLIVAVTDGEASHPHSSRWTPATLAAHRRSESIEGWQRLGIARSAGHRLGLPDGAVGAHGGRLAELLSDLLTPADVVFATWRHDGHPDHEATGQAAALACQRRQCSLFEYPVWMWQWAAPDEARVPWSRLRRVALGAIDQQNKAHAVRAHESQLRRDADGAAPVLPASALAHWLGPFEHVFVPEQLTASANANASAAAAASASAATRSSA